MPETKRCSRCGETKPFSEFSKHRGRKHGLGSHCRVCRREVARNWRVQNLEEYRATNRAWKHRRGMSRPMETAKDSSAWLGIYIAERVLSKFFDHIERMPVNNPGYDFLCSRGYKIDVKSGCLHGQDKRNPRWLFRINRNKIADYFLCLAFDNRESLTPMHIWLIPGNAVNENTGITVTNTPESRAKWSKYERPLEKVQMCCTALKSKGSA